MSEHVATVRWHRQTPDFKYETYNRAHDWIFPEKDVTVPASAAPAYKGEPTRVDPEEAFVASLSSCHMLTFLALAARKRFVVDRYEDEAVGVMAKNGEGRFWVSEVTLRPKVAFSGDKMPSAADLEELHHGAHEQCFIANSVKTEIRVEPR